jgi:hypothetical protein
LGRRPFATLPHRTAHSSSGLGHRPLTAAARVRIPYGPFIFRLKPRASPRKIADRLRRDLSACSESSARRRLVRNTTSSPIRCCDRRPDALAGAGPPYTSVHGTHLHGEGSRRMARERHHLGHADDCPCVCAGRRDLQLSRLGLPRIHPRRSAEKHLESDSRIPRRGSTSWDYPTHAAVSSHTSNAADSSHTTAHAAGTADTTHPRRIPLCSRLGLISRVIEGQDPERGPL